MDHRQDPTPNPTPPPSSPRSDKRRALLDGALRVFAEDGFSRASIGTIARTAEVSTRTIYNQFGDKASLFEAVIVDSAQRTAEAQIATVRQHLGKVVDLEDDLTAFARDWASPSPDQAPHFALVRQVTADVEHIPSSTLQAWQQAGPLRVRAEISAHLRRLADAGHLAVDDADLAAVHLVQLTAGDAATRSHHGAVPLPPEEIRRIADAGVRAFLHGYAVRD